RVGDTHAAVAHEGWWYGATILQRQQGSFKVRYLGYDATSTRGAYAFPDETLKAEFVHPAGAYPPIEVQWDGQWDAAVVVAPSGRDFKFHSIGYPASDDEVVPLKRIRYPFPVGLEDVKGARKK